MQNSFQFNQIPIFIQKYIDKQESGLENMTHDFCKEISNTSFDSDIDKDGKEIYIFKTNNYSIKRFVEFYLNKSSLDARYNCKYEDELDIPKSIMNEFFIAVISNREIPVYIESYENDKLVLKFI